MLVEGAAQSRTARLASAAAFLTIGGLALAAPALFAQSDERPPGWSEATHGDSAEPDYERLFAMDRVHTLRIRIAPEDFLAMEEDLGTIGRPGMRGPVRIGAPGAPQPPQQPGVVTVLELLSERLEASTAVCADLAPEAACSIDGTPGHCRAVAGADRICLPDRPAAPVAVAAPTGIAPGAPGTAVGAPANVPAGRGIVVGRAPQMTTRDPIYVPVTVTYDDVTWTGVGMRYKGNSSLMSAVMSNAGKVPFRLDFDRYEDEIPGIRNQRFYGFQKMTFSSNYTDDSMIKEVLATEAFRDQGVPAARAAFYRIYVDTGNGDEYWGLYTMIEDPADGAMLNAQFGDDDGNLYKPEGAGANWAFFDPAGFGKKTNESEADYSDVAAAVAALHAPQDDAAAWRAGLESHFDVDGFLRWLAVNSLIGNWDSYGAMAHNYYLYGDPGDDGRLRWIPWDHNMSFAIGMAASVPMPVQIPIPAPNSNPTEGGALRLRGMAPPGIPAGATIRIAGGPQGRGGDPLHREVNESTWPLIARILNDDVYEARYREALAQALDGFLAPETFAARVNELHALVAPYAVGPMGETPTHTTLGSVVAFERSAGTLIDQMTRQRDMVRTVLSQTR